MGKPTREEVLEREQQAWELRRRGWTQERIAAEIGVDQPAVSKILRRINDRALKAFEAEVGQLKAEHTARLEHVAEEAIEAWERSKKPAQALVKRTVRKAAGEGSQTGSQNGELVEEEEIRTETATGQVGDPGYLDEYRAALAEIRRIWGADAPQKHEHSGAGGKPIQMITSIEAVPPGKPDEPLTESVPG